MLIQRLISSIFGNFEEPKAWCCVAVSVDHDVAGAGDGEILASFIPSLGAIDALVQLVPVLADHHEVGDPDVAGPASRFCTVGILVSGSSQEQVVALGIHRHSPHLVVDIPLVGILTI